MANAAGFDLDQDFVRARGGPRDFFNRERGFEFAQDSGLHPKNSQFISRWITEETPGHGSRRT
jgi:hypothetical protein